MKLTITTMSGTTKNMSFKTEQEVRDFMNVFKTKLVPKQRVKITCDILGIDGYMQGDA